jgi:23S rRNA pseudouridine1911/1915/1917 synthase
MAHRRYPLIGDPTYGGRPRIPKGASDRLVDALRSFSRQALHARTLGFIHPGTNAWVEFECPLPDDILGLIAVLEQEDLPLARDTTLY